MDGERMLRKMWAIVSAFWKLGWELGKAKTREAMEGRFRVGNIMRELDYTLHFSIQDPVASCEWSTKVWGWQLAPMLADKGNQGSKTNSKCIVFYSYFIVSPLAICCDIVCV